MAGRRCRSAKPMIRSRRVSKYGSAATSSAPTRSRTSDANAPSNASSLLAWALTIRWPVAGAASSSCCSWYAAAWKFGLMSTPIRATPGTRSRSRPSRFGSIRFVTKVAPVILPPGRLRLATSPTFTGSPPSPNTIGIVAGGAYGAERARAAAGRADRGRVAAHQVGGDGRQAGVVPVRPTELDRDVLPLDEAAFGQAAAERGDQMRGFLRRARAHETDHRQRALLRAGGERPR